jgi:hypothetical protein
MSSAGVGDVTAFWLTVDVDGVVREHERGSQQARSNKRLQGSPASAEAACAP